MNYQKFLLRDLAYTASYISEDVNDILLLLQHKLNAIPNIEQKLGWEPNMFQTKYNYVLPYLYEVVTALHLGQQYNLPLLPWRLIPPEHKNNKLVPCTDTGIDVNIEQYAGQCKF